MGSTCSFWLVDVLTTNHMPSMATGDSHQVTPITREYCSIMRFITCGCDTLEWSISSWLQYGSNNRGVNTRHRLFTIGLTNKVVCTN